MPQAPLNDSRFNILIRSDGLAQVRYLYTPVAVEPVEPDDPADVDYLEKWRTVTSAAIYGGPRSGGEVEVPHGWPPHIRIQGREEFFAERVSAVEPFGSCHMTFRRPDIDAAIAELHRHWGEINVDCRIPEWAIREEA